MNKDGKEEFYNWMIEWTNLYCMLKMLRSFSQDLMLKSQNFVRMLKLLVLIFLNLISIAVSS